MKNFISWEYILDLQREDNLFIKDNTSGPNVSFIEVSIVHTILYMCILTNVLLSVLTGELMKALEWWVLLPLVRDSSRELEGVCSIRWG